VRYLLLMALALTLPAADLSNKKALNLAVIKQMVTAGEAEAAKIGVEVSLAIVDEAGNMLFFQKQDKPGPHTVNFAQRKARAAAIFRRPSKAQNDALIKEGNLATLNMPDAFPIQGGLPILIDGQCIGAVGVSGATAAQDEQVAQAAINAIGKK